MGKIRYDDSIFFLSALDGTKSNLKTLIMAVRLAISSENLYFLD